MKISPEKKKSNRKYPSLKDYKKKFMITTLTIGLALSPIMMSSCNSKHKTETENISKIETQKNTVLLRNEEPCDTNIIPSKENKDEIKKTEETKEDTLKKPHKLLGKVKINK